MRPLRYVVVLLLVLATLGALATWRLTRDPRPYFAERRTPLARVEPISAELVGRDSVIAVRLVASDGLAADVALRWPADSAAARLPLLFILGGHRTGKDAVGVVDDVRGFAVAALSYPYDGPQRPKGLEVAMAAPAIRRALLDTPPATRLALDWLLARAHVDTTRVELVGVSFGAPFAVIVGAMDERVARVWSVHGAGDPQSLLDHGLARYIGFAPARRATAWLAATAANAKHLAPERWVAGIAPRPFEMINAESDERIPRPAVELLHAAAREPKRLTWMPGQHVLGRRQDVVRQLAEMIVARVRATPLPSPAAGGQGAAAIDDGAPAARTR